MTHDIPPAGTFVGSPFGPLGFFGVGVPRSTFAAAAAAREEAGIGLGAAMVNVNDSGDICEDWY